MVGDFSTVNLNAIWQNATGAAADALPGRITWLPAICGVKRTDPNGSPTIGVMSKTMPAQLVPGTPPGWPVPVDESWNTPGSPVVHALLVSTPHVGAS